MRDRSIGSAPGPARKSASLASPNTRSHHPMNPRPTGVITVARSRRDGEADRVGDWGPTGRPALGIVTY